MSFFKRLFGKDSKEEPVSDNQLQWIEATQNKWGIRLLDLRPLTMNMLSSSSNPQMARNAISYNTENGTTFFGVKPKSERIIQCHLSFKVDQRLEPGVLFTPGTMEHKWAIFFDGEFLIFVRSWLREVLVIAKTETTNNRLFVKEIQGTFIEEEIPEFTVAILNYLLISHVLKEFVPAPLPAQLVSDTQKAGLWAFSTYGNKAEAGVFDVYFIPASKSTLRSHSLLHIAVAQSNLHEIEESVKRGIGLNVLAGDGLAPLHWAIAPDTTASMQKLIMLGADPDVKTIQGATPVMNAVQANKIDFLRLLLQAGAAVNAQDKRGFTALHRAAEMGYADIVELLLQNGADKNIAAENYTALSLATASGNQKIIELLS